jgi:predicted RNase H-like HicB family nuclease
MKYIVVIEKGEKGYGAYVPDLPGGIAAGETENDVRTLIQEAIRFHIEGLIEDGEPVPLPNSESFFIEVSSTATINP